jgi:hypothetical protein
MLYICIFSNKFDLIHAIRVSHNMFGNITLEELLDNKKLFFQCQCKQHVNILHLMMTLLKLKLCEIQNRAHKFHHKYFMTCFGNIAPEELFDNKKLFPQCERND